MTDEVKLLPCDRCGGKRTVRDIKPGVDWLRVYPEQMPCPDCTDGTWVDATRPPVVTDEVVAERLRGALDLQGGSCAETLQDGKVVPDTSIYWFFGHQIDVP